MLISTTVLVDASGFIFICFVLLTLAVLGCLIGLILRASSQGGPPGKHSVKEIRITREKVIIREKQPIIVYVSESNSRNQYGHLEEDSREIEIKGGQTKRIQMKEILKQIELLDNPHKK